MSETKKFTKEELDQIQNLRDANTRKVNEFGQIELEMLVTVQRLESLQKTKEDLQTEYRDLQKQEQELVNNLNDKYGAGTVDVASGEFIPAN
jgi:predicted transcriptional regulator|tara:strand:+ start:122 stop:397 length:276 start_codon:yes stop_codon:yes gene_type:complete